MGVRISSPNESQQTDTSVLTQPLFELNPTGTDIVPYISLDEFLSSDNEASNSINSRGKV